ELGARDHARACRRRWGEPFDPERTGARHARRGGDRPGGGMTIRVLLADDHAVIRDGLKALLERAADINVVGEADNGRDAVRRSEQLKPDVVVMDLTMPRLNGIDAARLLREKCPATHVVM